MSLLPFFQWCYQTAIGEAIRESTWLFLLMVDLRLFGLGLRRQPIARVAMESERWLIGSLAVMLPTGILLFLSESIKCYYSDAFWVKMTSLFLVLLFTFTVRRRVTRTGLTSDRPLLGRFTALISLGLWCGVAWGGRWIGFS